MNTRSKLIEDFMESLKTDPRVLGKWVDDDIQGYLVYDESGISMRASLLQDDLYKSTKIYKGSHLFRKRLSTKMIKSLLCIK